jgi:hypothetical protein
VKSKGRASRPSFGVADLFSTPPLFQPPSRQQGSGLPLRLKAGNAAVLVANLLGEIFKRVARAAHVVGQSHRILYRLYGLSQKAHACSAYLQRARCDLNLDQLP